mmetsp:Transcript_38214/g.151315  ORF Transcript_38214/g.151315 Transcript_38214/m.151315 type:complete len:325 (-) Transcript_38214:86-1060(-)
MREATNWSDLLLGQVILGGGVLLVRTLSDAIYLQIGLGPMMISVLSSTGNGVLYSCRMPSSNTCNLSQTTVSLSWETRDSPTGNNTLVTLSLRYPDRVDHLVLIENIHDIDSLLEQTSAKIHLIGHRPSIDLDLNDICLLLTEVELSHLRMSNDSHNRAVLLNHINIGLVVTSLTIHGLGVILESLLLRQMPILVEPSDDLIVQMLREHSIQCSKPTRSLDVSNNSYNHHRRSLHHRHGVHHLLLVNLRSRLIHVPHHMRHSSLVRQKRRQVTRLRGIILGKRLYPSAVTPRPLPRKKPKRSMSRSFELTVRHPSSPTPSFPQY